MAGEGARDDGMGGSEWRGCLCLGVLLMLWIPAKAGMTGGDCWGVLGMVALGALDSCPCFRRGDFLSQG